MVKKKFLTQLSTSSSVYLIPVINLETSDIAYVVWPYIEKDSLTGNASVTKSKSAANGFSPMLKQ